MHKNLNIGDYVFLKKTHPSKTTKWKIIRIGAKIKLQSYDKFDLFIELSREVLNKQIKLIEIKEEN